MATVSDYWCRMEAGRYRKIVFPTPATQVDFEIAFDPDSRLWHCRRNGVVFDAGRTLREAKIYCVEVANRDSTNGTGV